MLFASTLTPQGHRCSIDVSPGRVEGLLRRFSCQPFLQCHHLVLLDTPHVERRSIPAPQSLFELAKRVQKGGSRAAPGTHSRPPAHHRRVGLLQGPQAPVSARPLHDARHGHGATPIYTALAVHQQTTTGRPRGCRKGHGSFDGAGRIRLTVVEVEVEVLEATWETIDKAVAGPVRAVENVGYSIAP